MELLKLRAAREERNGLCAVDSTTRTAYGSCLADIRWGKNKENLPLPQTTEVVVYSLSNHRPIYYRTFPGNMPDSRSMDVILADLDCAGFKDLIMITDRGYESLSNLEKYILRGQRIIMCVKTGQRDVLKVIQELNEFSSFPKEMKVDPETKIFYKQYEIDYTLKSSNSENKTIHKLKLNLYFDPSRRIQEMLELELAKLFQEETLNELQNNKKSLDIEVAKKEYNYYKVICDPVTRVVKSFELRKNKIDKACNISGFFAIMNNAVNYDALETLKIYKMRDEQEKYFQQMKDQMVSDRQRNWAEEGKTGRLLILFVSLTLSSYVRYIWKNTKLHDIFSSSLEVIDEMKPIRFVEHNGVEMITPFIGNQLEICDAFGFEVPQGCTPSTYNSLKKTNRKRGRPPKKSQDK
jgi:hypothetical protein